MMAVSLPELEKLKSRQVDVRLAAEAAGDDALANVLTVSMSYPATASNSVSSAKGDTVGAPSCRAVELICRAYTAARRPAKHRASTGQSTGLT